MSALQLKETTMDKNNRVLLRVVIPTANTEEARDEAFETRRQVERLMGKDPEQKQLRRNKLETVHSAYCRKDTVVMEVALEEYYRLLTENVKKDRGFEKCMV